MALVVKNPPAKAGDTKDSGLICELGRSPGGGHSNPLQYSSLENLMGGGAWQAMAHCKESDQMKQLGTAQHI